MKKAILIIVIAALTGMVGWTLYEFLGSDSEEKGVVDGGVAITAPSENQGNETEGQPDEIGLEKGNMAPDFGLQTLEGDSVQLSDYQGQKVIVNFWATWCPPCREEIPDFQELYDNEDVDVEILAVDIEETEESIASVESFVDRFDMTFPVLMDESSEVAGMYQVPAYPTSYLIDSTGHIHFVAIGAMTYDQMLQELEKMN